MVRSDHYDRDKDCYRWRTLQPVNALLFVAPMLVAFHVGTALVKTSLFATRDLEQILAVFGPTASYLPPLLVAAALLVQHAARRDRWRADAGVFVGMVAESLFWALPLLALNYLCSRLLDAGTPLAAIDNPHLPSVLQAVGAGVYEEFVFRLLGLGLVTWIIVTVSGAKKHKDAILLLAMFASSLAFSLYHFAIPAGAVVPDFNWGDFAWRGAAGVCLALVYATRGFGIAVGAHVTWNLYSVLAAGVS